MTIKINANDPINKIDPVGTTPQNTGLPPRYENEPQAVKWGGSNRTAFCLPPIANLADFGWPENYDPLRYRNKPGDLTYYWYSEQVWTNLKRMKAGLRPKKWDPWVIPPEEDIP